MTDVKFDKDAAWQAVRDTADQILAKSTREGWNRGSGRGSMWSQSTGVGCHLKVYDDEGMCRVFWIQSTIHRWDRHLTTGVTESISWDKEEWAKRLAVYKSEPDSILVVNHKWYRLGGDRYVDGKIQPGSGFGGRFIEFRRILNPNAVMTQGVIGPELGEAKGTRNLWYGGIVPPPMRDQILDNAIFGAGFDGPGLNR